MNLLTKKTALITGGSDGIGLAIAIAFADQGADLVLVGRDRQKLERAKKELLRYNVRVLLIAADLSLVASVSDIVQQIRAGNMRIDIIVHNAGIARFIPFADTEASELDDHLNLNFKSPYLLTQALLDDLMDSRGNVIHISSYFARRMLPDRPSTAYSATKGALESLTRALAFELGPGGVRVNAIAPGTVNTKQVARNMERLDEDARDRFKAMIQSIYPLQRMGEPGDIAGMSVFLASDRAKWITGGIFPVDGGLTTH